jgi:hypothetical protein
LLRAAAANDPFVWRAKAGAQVIGISTAELGLRPLLGEQQADPSPDKFVRLSRLDQFETRQVVLSRERCDRLLGLEGFS